MVDLPFWYSFKEWWKNEFNIAFHLHPLEIIFGVANTEQDIVLNALNFCLLYARYYIYRCKLNNLNTCFKKFQKELKDRIDYEKCILTQDNKMGEYLSKWHTLFVSLDV